MSPQQELFTSVLLTAKELVKGEEVEVYDFLPQDNVKYPFIFIGEQFSHDLPNKSAVFGRVHQTIHFYHNDHKKRGDVSSLMDRLLFSLRSLRDTKNYNINLLESRQEIRGENKENDFFMKGILELEFHFSWKGKRG